MLLQDNTQDVNLYDVYFNICLKSKSWQKSGPKREVKYNKKLSHVSLKNENILIVRICFFCLLLSFFLSLPPSCLSDSCLWISHTVLCFSHTPVYSLWNIFFSFMLSADCLPSGVFLSSLSPSFFRLLLYSLSYLLKGVTWGDFTRGFQGSNSASFAYILSQCSS